MSQVLKPKKGYKKVKWLFRKEIEIPEEWNFKKIEECCDILDSKRIPINSVERKKIQGNIPYYGANGIQDYVNNYIFDEELILLAEDGGYFEEYQTRPIAQYVIGKCWINNHAHVLNAKNNNSLKWIFYSLVHKNIMPYINGSTRTKLNQSDLRQILISISPIKEQQKIVTILSNVDNLINSTQKIIDQTITLKKGLMQKLLTKGIGHKQFKKVKWLFGKEIEIPKEWEVTFLAKLILSTKNGFSGQPNDESRGLPRLGITSVTDSNSLYVNENLHRFIEIPKSIINDYQVKKNDLLVCRQNGNKPSVGKIRIVKKTIKPLIFSDSLILTRVDMKKVNPEFLVFFLDSLDGKKQISKYLGTTAGNYSINATDLRKIEIPCPPLSEQQQISIILSNVDSQIIFQIQYKEKLERLKKSLMQKLLTGKVRVIV